MKAIAMFGDHSKNKWTPVLVALAMGVATVMLPAVGWAEGGEKAIDWWSVGMGLFGGLAIFLFGMEEMSSTLKHVAGDKIKKILKTLSGNRLMGVVTGAGATAVVQSSSVTTVIVVGFISAGIMTLPQALGIILGANIGTTITAQIIAFKVTKFALVLVAFGFLMMFVTKNARVKQYGTLILGLGFIFFGMSVMGDAMKPLRSFQPFLDLMTRMDNPLFAIGVSAGFTALIQSSSATTGIIIALASQGLVSLEAGIALAMGANVGTCVTAALAAIGKPREAVRAAVAHTIFNVSGVLLIIPFIPYLSEFLVSMSGEAEGGLAAGAAGVAGAAVPRHIANAHTFFNVTMALLFSPFLGPYARLLKFLVPDKKDYRPASVPDADILDPSLTQVPLAALAVARKQLSLMTESVDQTLVDMERVTFEGDISLVQPNIDREVELAKTWRALSHYLSLLTTGTVAEDIANEVLALTRVSSALKNVVHIAVANMVRASTGSGAVAFRSVHVNFKLLRQYQGAVLAAYRTATEAFLTDDVELAYDTIFAKDEMSALEAELREHNLKHLRRMTSPMDVEAYAVEMEIIANLDQIYHHANQIAQLMVEDSAPRPDVDGLVTPAQIATLEPGSSPAA